MSHSYTPAANLIDVPGHIGDRAEELGVALGQWAYRDDGKPQPEVRRAANTAMDTIDDMLAELHRARQALIDEIRASDDATAARVDAMLAEDGEQIAGLAGRVQQATQAEEIIRRAAAG